MDLSFNCKMEAYYQKFIELQEKLRKSEEERLKLEMKFNEMLQVTREEEQAHYRKLRSQYKRFLEEDKKRQERNERIIRTLERIEARVNMLTSRTDRFKMLKRQYQSYIQRIARMRPMDKTENSSSNIGENTISEQQKCNSSEHTQDMPTQSSLKEALGKSNDEKIEILDRYLQNLATQKCKEGVENEEKDPQSDLSQLKYFDSINKKMEDGFNSNEANSIAEDIMNSIYTRHYKKDVIKDETKKASKFTASNCFNNDIPLKQKFAGVGDSYNTGFTLENLDNVTTGKNLSVDESGRNRQISNYNDNISINRNDSEFDDFIKHSGILCENNPRSLIVRDKQVDTKYDDKVPNKTLENRSNMLSKNKEYYTEVDALVKMTDDQSKAEPLLKRQEHDTKEFTGSNPGPILKDKVCTINEYPKSMEYLYNANKLQEKDIQSKDFSRNDSEYSKSNQRVKFEKSNDAVSYSPSKTEIDIIENEKQIANNYAVSFKDADTNVDKLLNDINDEAIERHEQDESEFEHSKYKEHQKSYDTEIADNETDIREKYLEEPSDNKIKPAQSYEELYITEPVKEQNDSLRECQETETVPKPDERLDNNEISQDKDKNDANLLAANVQNIPDCENNIDILSNEKSHDEYIQQHVINDDQSRYAENEAQIQYNQYEEPIQYDQFGNQIIYDENGQIVQPQYEENEQLFNQGELYDTAGSQQHNENKPDEQYDENGQLVHRYDQQFDTDGQPVRYDPQYDASDQPAQQLYDENGEVLQQYDQNGQIIHSYDQNSHPLQYDESGQLIPQYDESGNLILQYDESGHLIPQYDENGQLMQQYDESGQPIYPYDQSDQRMGYDENSTNQEYKENVPLDEHYNQDRESAQEYEPPFQQYENEPPVNGYNQVDQLEQEYEQSFPQYDVNGQPIQQYDESGQPIYQYDENSQPMQQYDKNGQLMNAFDENNLQYDQNDQPPEGNDGTGQCVEQNDNYVQQSQDVQILDTHDEELEKMPDSNIVTEELGRDDYNLEEEKSKTDSSKSTVKEDIINSPIQEENQPVKQNVLDMLDTDTENTKQTTSKISNDSDFDFSNG